MKHNVTQEHLQTLSDKKLAQVYRKYSEAKKFHEEWQCEQEIERRNAEKAHIADFFTELFALYQKYNVSISHEDNHGGFIIERYDKENEEWIHGASVFSTTGIEDFLKENKGEF